MILFIQNSELIGNKTVKEQEKNSIYLKYNFYYYKWLSDQFTASLLNESLIYFK